ncbi:hypothetical protein FGO68_gene1490 [Halteria grandinella]|uniref:TLDc domain-containing protein n=1 Tax=Halteria grandinella TaxID=5974 RepID=A0A8J8NPS6_HALGN|nr:hypothetical protein FGO68_gene1490 [Halteria grandinella]
MQQSIQNLHSQLKLLTENPEMSTSDSMKINMIRSDLDAIDVSLMFTSKLMISNRYQNPFLLTKLATGNIGTQVSEPGFIQLAEGSQNQMTDLMEQNKKLKEVIRKIVLPSAIINNEGLFNRMKDFFIQGGRELTQSKLLYKGSLHTFQASAFHERCDNKINTLVIIRTSGGKVIGGFTHQTWEGNGVWKKDESAWLFNIEAPSIFKVKKDCYAIHASSSTGPCFGSGSDLLVTSGCNKDCRSTAKSCSYDYNGKGNLFMNKQLAHFSASEIEVFQV